MKHSEPTPRRHGYASVSSSSLRAHRAKLIDGARARARFARSRREDTLTLSDSPSADVVADMRAAYPMNGQSRNYCVVLIAGSMRTHNKDWAGLVLATSRRGVTVKPLEVYRDDDVEIDDEDGGATKTAALRLRIAHAYPMKRLDGSAIMERLTFAPDGVGVVARRNAARTRRRC